jgi:PleD family two-component response regulator
MAKIVIVDDDVDCARNTESILKTRGHDTTLIHSTEKAVDYLIAKKPDLLVLDVMFPDNPVAGFDLAREVRRHREIKDLPILLLTGVNQEFPMGFSDGDIDSDWMPIQHFLEKPVKSADLLKGVDKLLAVPRK